MKIPLIIFQLAYLINGHADPCPSLKVLDSIVHIKKSQTSVNIKVSLTNCSDEAIMLFDLLGDVTSSLLKEDIICGKKIHAGAELFLFKDSNTISPRPEDYESGNVDFNMDTLMKLNNRFASMFRNNTKIIAPHKQLIFEWKTNLKDYLLPSGEYDFYIVYYAGERSIDFVDPDQISKQLKDNNARIFQGCIKSNKVRLIVN
jgi:hypothetical protein